MARRRDFLMKAMILCFAAAALYLICRASFQEGLINQVSRTKLIMQRSGLVIVIKGDGCIACDNLRQAADTLVAQRTNASLVIKPSTDDSDINDLITELGVTQYPSIFIFKDGVSTLYSETDRSLAKLKSLIPA